MKKRQQANRIINTTEEPNSTPLVWSLVNFVFHIIEDFNHWVQNDYTCLSIVISVLRNSQLYIKIYNSSTK